VGSLTGTAGEGEVGEEILGQSAPDEYDGPGDGLGGESGELGGGVRETPELDNSPPDWVEFNNLGWSGWYRPGLYDWPSSNTYDGAEFVIVNDISAVGLNLTFYRDGERLKIGEQCYSDPVAGGGCDDRYTESIGSGRAFAPSSDWLGEGWKISNVDSVHIDISGSNESAEIDLASGGAGHEVWFEGTLWNVGLWAGEY